MAMHIWNGSAWKAVNKDGGNLSDRGLVVWNGSAWVDATNAKVWNGSAWKGFVDNITLNNDYVVYYAGGGPVATVQWVVHAVTGYVAYTNNSGNTIDQYLWCANSDNTSQYEVKVDVLGGYLDAGSSATGTWLSCSTTRAWNRTTGDEVANVQLGASIRNAITQEVLAESIIDLEVSAA